MAPIPGARPAGLALAQARPVGATSAAITALAALTLALQTLDLATALRMMLVYGVDLEQNPILRTLMLSVGPVGLIGAKLGVVLLGVLLLVKLGRSGRPRLALSCLAICALLGLVGTLSNAVG